MSQNLAHSKNQTISDEGWFETEKKKLHRLAFRLGERPPYGPSISPNMKRFDVGRLSAPLVRHNQTNVAKRCGDPFAA
jgi:hypothetical protein